MKVTLINYSQPTEEMQLEGINNCQDMIAFCARVSNPANQFNTQTAEKLINSLVRDMHWSVFEMCSVTLEIETTRDIARQMLRHRSFSFQEFSQRYADPTALTNSFVLREARLQDTKNRQNSIVISDEALQAEWNVKQQEVIDAAKAAYDWARSKEIAKEQARCVLPEGNTISRLYMNGTIRSWIHYVSLRSHNGTQLEHMEIAKTCAEAISKIFPMITTYVGE